MDLDPFGCPKQNSTTSAVLAHKRSKDLAENAKYDTAA